MEISLTTIIGAALAIGLRVSGLMLFAPFFSSTVIPPQVKAVLTLALTAILYPGYAQEITATSLSHWPLVFVGELVIGVGMGIVSNLVFEAAQLAGQVLSIQVGYSLVNILDPTTQVESTVIGAFHQTLVMLIFLSLNVHQWIIRAVARSFEYLPPGSATITASFTQTVIHQGAVILATGVQLAAPVLAATLLTDIVLGLLSKASPQLPVMLLGTAVKSMLGLGVLAGAIRFWPGLFEQYFRESIRITEQIFHLART
ncbi:MAG: flagellar biosynthetic protein FliR [Terriglobales bacterium]